MSLITISNLQARSWSAEGCLKLKNLLGYGDIWDTTGSYGWDQTAELSAGLSVPRLGSLSTPLRARLSVLSQDWLKFSSYKEQLLGFSLGLFSTRHHDLAYNLTWRLLTDPSHTSSKSIRRKLGHSLLSSVKYVYKIDKRDSQLRPKRGYAFMSASHIGGLDPDNRSLRFVRQVPYFALFIVLHESCNICASYSLSSFISFKLSFVIFAFLLTSLLPSAF